MSESKWSDEFPIMTLVLLAVIFILMLFNFRLTHYQLERIEAMQPCSQNK